ncbi:heme peroxidase, partial [Lentinus tigrinus ALCF2SS1-7]|uniref:heme peroxidase n=1 Tax=Lentinus tigrinus ALCF2SS1-7 TaxID=1328758 RepID=UPI0011660B4B
ECFTAALTRRVVCPDAQEHRNQCRVLRSLPIRNNIVDSLFHKQCTEEPPPPSPESRFDLPRRVAFSPVGKAQGEFAGGGADGWTILFSETETNFHANLGTDDRCTTETTADLYVFLNSLSLDVHTVDIRCSIQFAGAIGIAQCPGVPQLGFMFGRKDAAQAAPNGLVPEPFDTVDSILPRMLDVGFHDFQVVWLLSAHIVAAADRVDDIIPRTPFDSTPEIFDTQFFIETQLRGQTFPGQGGIQGEVMSHLHSDMCLQSYHLLARDSRTSCEWQSFTNDREKFPETFPDVMGDAA